MSDSETPQPKIQRKGSIRGRLLLLGLGVCLAFGIAWLLTTDTAERKLLEYRKTGEIERDVAANPTSPWPYYTLGVRYAKLQRITDSVQMFEKARDHYPDAFDIRYALGKAYIFNGSPQKALPELQKAVSLDTKNANAYVHLAMARRLTGDKGQAKDAAKQATELDPKNAEAWYQYGILFTAQENNEGEGRPALKKAVELAPNEAVYNFAYGSSLTNASQFSEAIPYLRRALPKLAENYYLHFLLAVCLHRSGKSAGELEEAKSALQRAIQLAPNDYRAHFELGNIMEEQGQFAAALPEFRSAAKLYPYMGEIWFHLSRMLDRTGQHGEADQARAKFALLRKLHLEFETLSRHLREHPEDIDARLRVGQVFEQQGNPSAAALQYTDVLNRQPQNRRAKELLDALNRRWSVQK